MDINKLNYFNYLLIYSNQTESVVSILLLAPFDQLGFRGQAGAEPSAVESILVSLHFCTSVVLGSTAWHREYAGKVAKATLLVLQVEDKVEFVLREKFFTCETWARTQSLLGIGYYHGICLFVINSREAIQDLLLRRAGICRYLMYTPTQSFEFFNCHWLHELGSWSCGRLACFCISSSLFTGFIFVEASDTN